MIGAAFEIPFSLSPAIRSRVQIFELEPLTTEEVRQLTKQLLDDPDRGFDFPVVLDEDLSSLPQPMESSLCLYSLDLAVLVTSENAEGIRHITLEIMKAASSVATSQWLDGDGHYGVLSALQSLSVVPDVDASLTMQLV